MTKKLSGQEGEAPLFYDFFILHILYYLLTLYIQEVKMLLLIDL